MPAERAWRTIPILGWIIANQIWLKRAEPIVLGIEAELKARPKPNHAVWGSDLERMQAGSVVAITAMHEIGWPNDHFLPSDPALVVFWAYADGLDVDFAFSEIERELKVKLDADEIRSLLKRSLGELVDGVLAKRTASRTTIADE